MKGVDDPHKISEYIHSLTDDYTVTLEEIKQLIGSSEKLKGLKEKILDFI